MTDFAWGAALPFVLLGESLRELAGWLRAHGQRRAYRRLIERTAA